MSSNHKRLVIPGPVEVRREILEAQTEWMIGHRSAAFAELFGRLQGKLKQAFLTQHRVIVSGSSGTGLWEGASRNCIRDGQRALHLVGGAFSERWAEVSQLNGKEVDVIEVEWGKAHTPEMVADALKNGGHYDAVCFVHNETSTGVTNPVKAISAVVHELDPDALVLVDTVSGFLGAEFRTDEWGVDIALTSSQKAFALPPGIAFAAVSDRVLERAKQVKNRGYYFDFLELDKLLQKNNTPSTPPIALMFAADKQLDDILAEGLDNRWARHLQMRDLTIQWADSREMGLFAQDGYRSPTVTTVANGRGISVDDMAKFMGGKGFSMDKGYGKIKGQTFRIAHMGDMTISTLEEVLAGLDEFLGV
ncbi:MAG: alanine--glyoxylate aminotransferase family protein [Chloroflexi bacterium]|jgi:predicted phosphoserine aminotransferase|nr:alanine--glyoxylate aminotransferase family protein [Chloroflexota bacterium]MDL1884056.1 alanine--glyoxylate aminotransferase family protein [Anaerolineae bacterium CFX8]